MVVQKKTSLNYWEKNDIFLTNQKFFRIGFKTILNKEQVHTAEQNAVAKRVLDRQNRGREEWIRIAITDVHAEVFSTRWCNSA